MEFVGFSEEQGPQLVMEYLPLGNLTCQDSITEEETLKVLYQGLQAVEYLHSHSPPLAHRDITPGNILVQSRIPFIIKLGDFGLAKNDSILKTVCGTYAYAAPEIWEDRHYTAMVDIWSLGVVVLQYGYGLPKPSQKRRGKPWCQDIVKWAANMEGEGDNLIDLISTKMLKMDYRDRQSASDCLGEMYRLGFHAVPTIENGRATPTGKMTGPDNITRTESIITQLHQNAPSDSDGSSEFHDPGGASETTEVAPSKRDLREGVHFYNRSQGSIQIRNPQSEEKATPTPNKRRRPQTTQPPTTDALGRERSKRSRALISCNASEQPSKASNPRQEPEQLESSISSNHERPLVTDVANLAQGVGRIPQVKPSPTQKRTRHPSKRLSVLATEANLRDIEKPSSKHNVHDHEIATLAGNLDGGNEAEAKVHPPSLM